MTHNLEWAVSVLAVNSWVFRESEPEILCNLRYLDSLRKRTRCQRRPSARGLRMSSELFSQYHCVPCEAETRRGLEALPQDVTVRVLEHLSAQDVCALRTVSRKMHGIASSGVIWRSLLRNDFDETMSGVRTVFLRVRTSLDSDGNQAVQHV